MNGKQLKNSILQWAIQGKLVPQDPNDEPASVLLEKIRAEKERLVKEGKLKKKDLEVKPIAEDEIPFEIPDNWEWCRLGGLCDYIHRGKSPKYGIDRTLPIIAQKCNQWDKIYTEKCLFAEKNFIEKYSEEHFLQIGDTIINSTGGGTVGRTGYVDNYVFAEFTGFVADSHVTVVRTNRLLNKKYVYYYLISPLIQNGLEDRCSGSTNQIELGTETIKNYRFPLPPLSEQHRIVAKIEELMPLVEKYGETQEALEEWNNSLPEKLKKSILQEAIQGKLVPQDPNDEPASVLLERIREEKKRLVKEGKLKKKDLEVKPIEEEQIPYEIPESWEWCKIEDITLPIGNKSNQIQSKEVLNEGDVPVVSQGQKLIDGYSNEINKTIKELPVIMFGDHTRNVKLIDFPFVIGADGTKFFKPILCEAQYLYYVVLYVASKLRDRGYARHYTLLKEEPLPLPPLAEQRRIVSKIEELFGVIKK